MSQETTTTLAIATAAQRMARACYWRDGWSRPAYVFSVYDKVTNGLNNWDTHVNKFSRLNNNLLPLIDMAFSVLVEDLADRGLLDSTLVVGIGEFGRTPA